MIGQEYKDWLSSLKVGDRVAINVGSYGYRSWHIIEITKITPTGIIKTSDNRAFNKDGYERGGGSRFITLEPITDEIKEQMERVGLLRIIKNTDFSKASTAQLREIVRRLEK